MSSHVHIGLYNALREAGASEENAQLASAEHDLATKADLKADLAALKADLFRQLWLMAAGIVTLNAVLMTAALTLTRFLSQ